MDDDKADGDDAEEEDEEDEAYLLRELDEKQRKKVDHPEDDL